MRRTCMTSQKGVWARKRCIPELQPCCCALPPPNTPYQHLHPHAHTHAHRPQAQQALMEADWPPSLCSSAVLAAKASSKRSVFSDMGLHLRR